MKTYKDIVIYMFGFGSEHREIYCGSLSLDYFKGKFEALENSSDMKPTELGNEIKLLLMENTKAAPCLGK